MKKLMFLLIVVFPFASGHSQETLNANESHVVTLFFPSPIRQAITGAEHFTFSYNRESGQHFGLLQANKGRDSNLLVLTEDGRVYTYGLAYSKHLLETYRFIQLGESIGLETETKLLANIVVQDTVPKIQQAPQIDYEKELMAKGSTYLMGKKSKTLGTKRKKDMILRLKELFYHRDRIYVKFEIQNNSAIDFELDVLEIYKINGKKGKRSSHQKVQLKPIYKYCEPGIIRSGYRQAFVHVLPKFTLGDAEKLLIELHEKKGNRMLLFKWN